MLISLELLSYYVQLQSYTDSVQFYKVFLDFDIEHLLHIEMYILVLKYFSYCFFIIIFDERMGLRTVYDNTSG